MTTNRDIRQDIIDDAARFDDLVNDYPEYDR